MKRIARVMGVVCFVTHVCGADLVHYVNPLLGTAVGSGNTCPGPQAPFGMISGSPQTTDCGWSPPGYKPGRVTAAADVPPSDQPGSVTH